MSTPESTAGPKDEAEAGAGAEPGAGTAEPGAGTAEPGVEAMPEPATEATPEALAEPAPEPMPEPMPAAMPELMPAAMPEPMPAAMPEPATGATFQAMPETMHDAWPAMPDAMPDTMPDTMAEPAPGPMPAAGAGTGPSTPGDDLRAAVGLPGQPARDGAQPRGPGRRIALLIGVLALLGVVVAGLVFLGRQNQQRYYLVCGEDDITAAQGRSFPPWGRSALEGKAWQAIPRPLDGPCDDRVFGSREALARSFGETLVARVEAWVTARADGAGHERLAEAQAQIDQAQRVLRELRDPKSGHAEASARLQRLRGDLDYWQARDRIDAAMAELARAAQHLDSAVAHDPHRNRENALMWQRVVARLQAELGRGTPGAAPSPAPSSAASGATSGAAPGAGAGTALPAMPGAPAEPGPGSPGVPSVDTPGTDAGPSSDAGPTSAPAAPGATAPATSPGPPDAGVRRGGLLI